MILGKKEYYFCISYSFHKLNYNGILDSKYVYLSTQTQLSPFNIRIVYNDKTVLLLLGVLGPNSREV